MITAMTSAIPFHVQVLLVAVFGLLLIQTAASLVGFYTFLKTRKLLDEAMQSLKAIGIHAKISERQKEINVQAIKELKEGISVTAKEVKEATAESFKAVDEKLEQTKTELAEKIIGAQGDSGTGIVQMHSPAYSNRGRT